MREHLWKRITILDLLIKSVSEWNRSEAPLRAAALAYYTIFSLAPLLIVSVAIASLAFSRAAAEGRIVAQIEGTVGEVAATAIQDILVNSTDVVSGSVATGIGILLSLYGASTVFWQLRASLNAMWGIAPRERTLRQNIVAVIKGRLLSAAAVLATGFVPLISLLINALWSAVPEGTRRGLLSSLAAYVPLLRLLASPVVFTVVFALIFKLLPQAKIRWREVWLGAAVTALLFWLGNALLGLYLAHSVVTSLYGAAGSLVAFLVWTYYTASIVLFGAKFTQVYANQYGVPIVPHGDARFRAAPPSRDQAHRRDRDATPQGASPLEEPQGRP